MSFESDLNSFMIRTMQKAELTLSETIKGLTISLVDRSPVGDASLWASPPPKDYKGGHFKANWQGGVDGINYLVTDDIDPTGELSITSVIGAIPPDLLGRAFYITNSLPYAQALEDGHSSQAPAGMVGLTILDFQSIINKAVLTAVGAVR